MNGLKLIGIVGLALVTGSAWGQPGVEWERTYGGSNNDLCHSLIQTSDGGFALSGVTNSFGSGGGDFWLVRTSSEGDSLWSRTFGGQSGDFCTEIIQTTDGGFALAGYTASFGAGSYDFWLIRTDANGDSLWSHTYGGEDQEKCNSLIQTTDGGFALAGSTGTNLHGNVAFYLIRTDENGDSLWSRTYDIGLDDECESLIQTADGGFALAGFTLHGSGYDNRLIRTDENGEVLWSRSYGGELDDECYSLVQSVDGGFVMAGASNSFGSGNFDVWLVRTNSDGDSLWSRTFGGVHSDYCTSLIQIADGSFALAGITDSFGAGGDNFWLVRAKSNSDSLWSRTFGGDGLDECSSLVQTSNGCFIMAGSTSSLGAGNQDFYLVKTTPDPVSVTEYPFHPHTLLLSPPFPNPFNSSTTIAFGLDRSAPTRLAIFDPLGHRIAEVLPGRLMGAGKYSVMWNASGVPAGEYVVRLEAGGRVDAKKVVVVK